MTRGRNWSEREDNLLIENKHLADKELTKLINRSQDSIKTRRYRLGLGERKKITDEDKQFMLDNYGVKSVVEIANTLGVHRTTVETHLKKMGVYVSENDKSWVAVDYEAGIDNESFYVEIEYEFKGEV